MFNWSHSSPGQSMDDHRMVCMVSEKNWLYNLCWSLDSPLWKSSSWIRTVSSSYSTKTSGVVKSITGCLRSIFFQIEGGHVHRNPALDFSNDHNWNCKHIPYTINITRMACIYEKHGTGNHKKKSILVFVCQKLHTNPLEAFRKITHIFYQRCKIACKLLTHTHAEPLTIIYYSFRSVKLL